MNCEQFESLLLDYAGGRANPDPTFEQHLAGCPSCRTRAEGFRRVSATMDEWDTPEISPWFNARLRQRIAEEEASRWSWQRMLGWMKQPVAAAAFAVILIVGSIAVWSARPAVQQPVREMANVQANDELAPLVEDFDMLASFEVIQDLKTKTPAAKDKSGVKM